MLSSVARFIAEHGLLQEAAAVLVGVSGGADSVVLLHVLARLGYAVRAAHVNYGLRGEASDGDEAFVRAYCAARGVPLAVAHFDTEAEAARRGQSVQAAARGLRYAWFAEEAVRQGCAAVAVAHHLDDQAETVLLNLFHGSGPEGLAGMPPRRPLRHGSDVVLVRPLLAVRRADVEAYARAEGLSWRTDASNASLHYRRGAVREAILPLVEAHFGAGVAPNIARAAALLRGYVEDELGPALAAAFAALAEEEPGGGGLRLAGLAAAPPVWRHRLLLEGLRRWLPGAPYTLAAASSVDALVAAQPGRRVVFPQGAVWRDRDRLVFLPAPGPAPEGAAAEARVGLDVPVQLPGGVVAVDALGALPVRLADGAPYTVYADAEALSFPLTLRPWRAGDRFQPLGLDGFKKLSDFLTDAKVPPHGRRDVHVLLSGGDVVWVVGYRLDHRFRVRPETRRAAKISFIRRRTGEEGGA